MAPVIIIKGPILQRYSYALKVTHKKSRIGGLLDLKVEIKLETKHSPLNQNKKHCSSKQIHTIMPINMYWHLYFFEFEIPDLLHHK